MCVLYAPLRPSSSGCRIFLPHLRSALLPVTCQAMTLLCGLPAAAQWPIGISSQSVGEFRAYTLRSASGAVLSLSLSNNRRSTLWKLRRTLPICLRIIWGTTCPESDRRRILLNCL